MFQWSTFIFQTSHRTSVSLHSKYISHNFPSLHYFLWYYMLMFNVPLLKTVSCKTYKASAGWIYTLEEIHTVDFHLQDILQGDLRVCFTLCSSAYGSTCWLNIKRSSLFHSHWSQSSCSYNVTSITGILSWKHAKAAQSNKLTVNSLLVVIAAGFFCFSSSCCGSFPHFWLTINV